MKNQVDENKYFNDCFWGAIKYKCIGLIHSDSSLYEHRNDCLIFRDIIPASDITLNKCKYHQECLAKLIERTKDITNVEYSTFLVNGSKKPRYFENITDIKFIKQYYREGGFRQFVNDLESTHPKTRIEVFNYRLKFWLCIAIMSFILYFIGYLGKILNL